jgi:hypothetical protein
MMTHPTLIEGLIPLFSSAASRLESTVGNDRVGVRDKIYKAASE